MLSYNDQWRMRRKRGSGLSLIAVSVGDLACVWMMPLLGSRLYMSVTGAGFSLLTSSLSTERIRSPLTPFQPDDPPAVDRGDRPRPACVWPASSIDEMPTMACQRRSLSSRPRSEAREYIIEEMGSAKDEPRLLYLSRTCSSWDHFFQIFSSRLCSFRLRGAGDEERLSGVAERDESEEPPSRCPSDSKPRER